VSVLTLSIAMILIQPAVQAPELAPAAFDEAALKLDYEGFLLQWWKPLNLETGPMVAFRERYQAYPKPLPDVALWPIDAARGVLVNDITKRAKEVAWQAVDVVATPDPPPENFDWASIALVEEAWVGVTPKLCVPEACWFESHVVAPRKKPVVNKPGIWIALRALDGRPIIAGILIYKSLPKGDPRKEALFVKWKTELATKFPLTH
jgi:hypothetical protein